MASIKNYRTGESIDLRHTDALAAALAAAARESDTGVVCARINAAGALDLVSEQDAGPRDLRVYSDD